MAPPTMKLANRSNVYTSVSIVFDNRENCKQCQPSLNGLVSTGVCENRISLKAARVVRNIISFHYSSRTEESIQVCLEFSSFNLFFISKGSQLWNRI